MSSMISLFCGRGRASTAESCGRPSAATTTLPIALRIRSFIVPSLMRPGRQESPGVLLRPRVLHGERCGRPVGDDALQHPPGLGTLLLLVVPDRLGEVEPVDEVAGGGLQREAEIPER